MALVHLIKLRSTMAPPSIKMWDSCNWVYMGFTTFKVEVLRLLSAYLHRAASAYLCHGALSAECKYVSEFVYLLNISSKGLVTQCPLCLNRDLCDLAPHVDFFYHSVSFPMRHCFVLHIHNSTNISDEGEWTSWEDWSSCTVACGAGTQFRSRGYSGGLPCSGNSSQTANCYGISHYCRKCR